MIPEETPLLAAGEQEQEIDDTPEFPNRTHFGRSNIQTRASEAAKAFLDHWLRWKVIYACAIFIFIIDFPGFMRIAPFLRIFELSVCRDYYKAVDPSVIAPNGDIDEALCKLGDIQSRFANYRAILGAIEPIPGLILAIPYGIMADTRGRRIVALLCCFGVIFAEGWILLVLWLWRIFPTTAVFAYPVFMCIGGGGPVFAAVILAVVADVCPSHLRTRVFFGITVVLLTVELVAPPVGSLFMNAFNSYIAYSATMPMRLLTFLFPLVVPETQPKEPSADQPTETRSDTDSTEPAKKSFLGKMLDNLFSHVRSDVLPLIMRPPIILSLITFLVSNFARTQGEFSLQYLSMRFNIRYSKVAYIISFTATVHIILLCTVLPLAHKLLDKRYGHAEKANLVLAKGSVIFLIVGPIIFALANQMEGIVVSIVVFTLGSGFGAAMRSFVTSLVPKNETALLYTMISIFTSLGTLIGTPLVGLIFSAGIRKGGAAIGLPFFVGSALYFISGLAVWFLSVPVKTTDEERDQTAEPLSPRDE